MPQSFFVRNWPILVVGEVPFFQNNQFDTTPKIISGVDLFPARMTSDSTESQWTIWYNSHDLVQSSDIEKIRIQDFRLWVLLYKAIFQCSWTFLQYKFDFTASKICNRRMVSKIDQELDIVWSSEVWLKWPLILETFLHIFQGHELNHWNQL